MPERNTQGVRSVSYIMYHKKDTVSHLSAVNALAQDLFEIPFSNRGVIKRIGEGFQRRTCMTPRTNGMFAQLFSH